MEKKFDKSLTRYVLITPCKDEEKTIKKVVDSVKKQTRRPYIWIIVNDGSTDSTDKILAKETKNIKWIYVLNKTVNNVYNWLGYSKVINEGIRYLNSLIKKGVVKERFDFLGLLDSDITIEKDYFASLIKFLLQEESIVSISGNVFIKKRLKWIPEDLEKGPRGGARIFRYKNLCEIGGFPYTPSPDRVADIKFLSRGFQIKRLLSLKAYQHRETFARTNKMKGYFLLGRTQYLLSYGFLYVLFISIQFSFRKRPYFLSGFVFFLGYITGFLTQDERIHDAELISYKNKFLKRIFANAFNK